MNFYSPALLFALIHRSAWNWNSANFAFWGFSDLRYALATPSNSKDTTFGGCAIPHNLGTLPPNRGQRPRTASRRRWAPRRRGEPVVQPAAVLRSPDRRGRRGLGVVGIRFPAPT